MVDRYRPGIPFTLRDLDIPAIGARNSGRRPALRQFLRQAPCPDPASGVGQVEMANAG